CFFCFQAEEGIRDDLVTGVQMCALPIFGQHVADVDFALAPVRTARISGHVVDSSGEPWAGAVALSASERSGAPLATSMGARLERSEERRVGNEGSCRWSWCRAQMST